MAFLGGLSLLGSAGQSYRDIQEQQAQTAARRRQLQDQTDAQQGSLAIGSIPPEAWGGTIPGVAGGAAPGGPQMPAGGAAGAAAGIQPPPQQPAGGAAAPGGGQSGAPISFNYPQQQQQQNPIMAALQQLARGLTQGAGGGQPPGYTETAGTRAMPFVPQDMQGGPGATQQQPSNGDTGFDAYRDPNQTMRQRTGLDQPGQPGRPFAGGGQQVAQAQQPTQPWQPGRPIQTMADLAGAIRRYNPGISPRAFAHAMSIGMKLLGQEAQQEYMRQRPELQREAISERERAAEMAHPGAGAFQDWLISHPQASPEEVGSALTQFTGKAQILQQRGAQARELEQTKQTGRMETIGARGEQAQKLQQQKADAALKLEGVKEMDRENLLALGAKNKMDLEKEKQDYATANYPFGRSAEGMSMYLFYKAHPNAGPEDYWAAKAKSRPPSAGQVREEARQQQAQATVEDIGEAMDLLIDNPDVPMTGILGIWSRGKEFVTGAQDTPATRFQSAIRTIQEVWPQSVARRSITNAQERSHLDEIILGLGRFTSRQQAMNSLREAQKIIRRHAGIKDEAAPDEDELQTKPVPAGTEKKPKPLDEDGRNLFHRLVNQGFTKQQAEDYLKKKGYNLQLPQGD